MASQVCVFRIVCPHFVCVCMCVCVVDVNEAQRNTYIVAVISMRVLVMYSVMILLSILSLCNGL